MNSPFKIYILILFLMTIIGFKDSHLFNGNRIIASDCVEMARILIQKELPAGSANDLNNLGAQELKHYQFKNSIWTGILGAEDFEKFDESEYFRFLGIYKNESSQEKTLLSINAESIEQKLALIETIQQKFSFFQDLPSIQDEIQNLNAYKLKQLQNLMTKFDLSTSITRENLEEFSSDFFLILNGPPVNVLDNFLKNKSALMNQRMIRILKEDMLTYGLKGSILRVGFKKPATELEKARFTIKKIMKFKAWRFLLLPYDLPWVDRVKVSDQLIEKILMDGLDKHQAELLKELKRQNVIDQYERLRKVYRPVALGIGFYFFYEKYQDHEEQTNEEAKKKLMDDFEKLSAAINAGDSKEKTEEEIKEIQFQRVLKSFKEHYHHEPAPEEYKQLHQKIFNTK